MVLEKVPIIVHTAGAHVSPALSTPPAPLCMRLGISSGELDEVGPLVLAAAIGLAEHEAEVATGERRLCRLRRILSSR